MFDGRVENTETKSYDSEEDGLSNFCTRETDTHWCENNFVVKTRKESVSSQRANGQIYFCTLISGAKHTLHALLASGHTP